VITIGPTGGVPAQPGTATATLTELADPANKLGKRLRGADRAVLIWSGPGGGGGARLAEFAHELGFHDKPGCGAFHLPATPNARGVAHAWACAADGEEQSPEPIGLLIVSGDEAASDPSVRALAEKAEAVLAITMFQGLATGWADLVLPGTSYLEREGTMLNLEGRPQRQRRAVLPPVPDELAWISRLAARFGIEVSPHSSVVFAEVSAWLFPGLERVSERAELPARAVYEPPDPGADVRSPVDRTAGEYFIGELRLLRYRPLFSGPQVERVRELDFQRPEPELELAPVDAEKRAIASGDMVHVRSNGTSVELRARIDRRLAAGVARVADEHAGDLHQLVEVVRA
jgi:anaerobic selenocysteine-containing dehydrogenase